MAVKAVLQSGADNADSAALSHGVPSRMETARNSRPA
jgi:hypothetical protein